MQSDISGTTDEIVTIFISPSAGTYIPIFRLYCQTCNSQLAKEGWCMNPFCKGKKK